MLARSATLTILLSVLGGTAVTSAPSARADGAADASSCYVIGDPDARAYCLARARRDPGTCYAIQRPDLRTQCLAEVRR